MRLKKNGKGAAWMWALCTICILFSRICFDNVQADPYLAYRETAPGSVYGAAGASYSDSVYGGTGTASSGGAYGAAGASSSGSTYGEAGRASFSFDRGCKTVGGDALDAPQKGIPAQAYVPTGQTQGNAAFIPRKTAQRINSRYSTNNASGILPAGVFSDTFFSGQTARSLDGSCEVFSNTVILHYIHRQDGEK